MKADHRKELQTNWLADSLGNALHQAKEGPSPKVYLYGGLAVLVVVLVGFFYWYSTRSKDSDALRWQQWNQVTQTTTSNLSEDEKKKLLEQYAGKSPDWVERLHALEKFEADNAGTPQARLARFQQARMLLENTEAIASTLLTIQRRTTLTCIAKGRDLYERLSGESADVPALAEEALFNAGKANEDLGDFDRAKKHYERLKKEYPKSLYGPAAEKALTRLSAEQDELDQLKKLAETKQN